MILIFSFAACAPQSLAAAYYFPFDFTSSGNNKIVGVLTANPTGPGTYLVTGISGLIYGFPGAGPIGNLVGIIQPSNYNHLYFPKNPGYFNVEGIAFYNSGYTYYYNLFFDNAGDQLWVVESIYPGGFTDFSGVTTVLPEIDGNSLPKAIFIITGMYLILFHSAGRRKQSIPSA